MGSFSYHFKFHRGFTLIELLVVAAIIIAVTSVIFAEQRNFSSTSLLTNTTYDIALTAHDAETYGLGTRAQSGAVNAGYGVDFQRSSPSSYTLFTDTNPAASILGCHGLPPSGAGAPNAYPGNCYYDANDAIVLSYALSNGMTISNFCAYNGAWSCSSTCSGVTGCTTGVTQLDIIYLRPNAAPFMSTNRTWSASPLITQSCIRVSSPQNTSAYVSFSSTGQIAVAPSCP